MGIDMLDIDESRNKVKELEATIASLEEELKKAKKESDHWFLRYSEKKEKLDELKTVFCTFIKEYGDAI